MGLLARRLAEEVRDRASWLSDDDDDDYFEGRPTPAGVRVGRHAAFSLGAFWRCVDLLTGSVANSPKDVFLKVGGRAYEQFAKPAWLTMPIPADPTFTDADHFAQVALSLLIDGNAFVRVTPYTGDPRSLIVLNPLRVRVQPGPVYELRDESGSVIETLKPLQVLHAKWMPLVPGSLRSLNPISALSRSLGAAIASEEFAGRFFGQGATLSFGVEAPGALTQEQKDELRNQLRRHHAGLGNSHAIGILTAGAKFVPGLTPTPEQAQMLDTRKFAVVETCRPFGVPPVLAGVNDPGSVSYASSDIAVNTMYQRHAVLPLASRIESQYQRLFRVPEGVNDPSATMQFRFNLDWIARTDLLTRAQAGAQFVQSGQKTPNEVRKLENLPPLPGGDQLYMQSQMVPLGQLGQPAAPAGRSTEVTER